MNQKVRKIQTNLQLRLNIILKYISLGDQRVNIKKNTFCLLNSTSYIYLTRLELKMVFF